MISGKKSQHFLRRRRPGAIQFADGDRTAAGPEFSRFMQSCPVGKGVCHSHDNGQPYLENCVTNISITHTEKYVAIIIHDEEDLGIDIESLDRDFSAVEKKALSEDEIDDLEKEKRNEQLAIYWCAKEAIFKRMSQNRVNFAEQIEVERFNLRKEGELEATFIHKDEHEEEFDLEYMIFDRHVLVWLVG